MAQITFKVGVISSSVAKITFVRAEITFKVAGRQPHVMGTIAFSQNWLRAKKSGIKENISKINCLHLLFIKMCLPLLLCNKCN